MSQVVVIEVDLMEIMACAIQMLIRILLVAVEVLVRV